MDAHYLGLHLTGTCSGAVAAHMGMGIGLIGLAVGSPSGMSYAAGTGQGVSVICLLRQNL